MNGVKQAKFAILYYRGQDVSAFQPSADLILVADCIYYEEVRKLRGR